MMQKGIQLEIKIKIGKRKTERHVGANISTHYLSLPIRLAHQFKEGKRDIFIPTPVSKKGWIHKSDAKKKK